MNSPTGQFTVLAVAYGPLSRLEALIRRRRRKMSAAWIFGVIFTSFEATTNTTALLH